MLIKDKLESEVDAYYENSQLLKQYTDYNNNTLANKNNNRYFYGLDVNGRPAKPTTLDGLNNDTNMMIEQQTNIITIVIVSLTTAFIFGMYLQFK